MTGEENLKGQGDTQSVASNATRLNEAAIGRGGSGKFIQVAWNAFFLMLIILAFYLLGLSLFPGADIWKSPGAGQSQSANSAQQAGTPSNEASSNTVNASPAITSLENKVVGLEARLNEMSNRITELGNHSTQVLTVVGFLISVASIVVAIGLWHARQYIAREVDMAKIAVKATSQEETQKQLEKVRGELNSEAKEIKTHAANAQKELEDLRKTALADLGQITEDRVDVITLGLPLTQRIQQIVEKTFELALAKQLISAKEFEDLKNELNQTIWTQTLIAQAIVQLESSKEAEVLSGCHILSALGDQNCISAIKNVLPKWNENERVHKQISAAYNRLSSKQDGYKPHLAQK